MFVKYRVDVTKVFQILKSFLSVILFGALGVGVALLVRNLGGTVLQVILFCLLF